MQSDLTQFYEKQISLTEWFEAIGHPQAAALRLEDNDKRERLGVLHDIIGIGYDKPTAFPMRDVIKPSPTFKTFLKNHGTEACAIHLIPADPKLPKYRMRGHTIAEAAKWVAEQSIDPAKYRASFAPHTTTTWATIFVVSEAGIYGEITHGEARELTQGLYAQHKPVTFGYNFKTWQWGDTLPQAQEHVQEIIQQLHVSQAKTREKLRKAVGATFAHNYLAGYFESVTSQDYGIWFIDYNRLLHEELNLGIAPAKGATKALVTGRCASPGKTKGTVRIVTPDQLHAQLGKNTILVCTMTTPDYLPLMQQAAAIVTDLGGVLSHAAIIARELKKPCLTGTGNATKILKHGQQVIVDATNGVIVPA